MKAQDKLDKLIEILYDKNLMDKIGKCDSNYHDDRYCSVCENRNDAIEYFIEYLERELEL